MVSATFEDPARNDPSLVLLTPASEQHRLHTYRMAITRNERKLGYGPGTRDIVDSPVTDTQQVTDQLCARNSFFYFPFFADIPFFPQRGAPPPL
jgi:hypothetical protein